MRYPPFYAARTRRRIVDDASRRVRAEGLTGAAVSAVMRDAGLTHGGFYKHFRSKEHLVVESLRQAFNEIATMLARAAEHVPRRSAWKAIVNTYLSLQHCDHPERGCPVAALASEFARADRPLKTQIAREMRSYRRRLLPFMPGRRAADKERAFFTIISTMLGAIAIARILPSKPERAQVLATARRFLLRTF